MDVMRLRSSALLLAALMVVAGPARAEETSGSVAVFSEQLDPEAFHTGLRARLGPTLDGWTIEVRDVQPIAGADPGAEVHVEVGLRQRGGEIELRRLVVTGDSSAARSRDLAASVAHIVRFRGPSPAPQGTTPDDPPPPTTAPRRLAGPWIGLGPTLSLGGSPRGDLAGGVHVRAGGWLARGVVQPLGGLSWMATLQDGLSLHALRLGAGVAIGAPVFRERLWVGARVLPQASWVRVSDARSEGVWMVSGELTALVQYRLNRLLLGLHAGAELNLPPLTAFGSGAQVEWRTARFLAGITVGFVFGSPGFGRARPRARVSTEDAETAIRTRAGKNSRISTKLEN